MVMVLTKEKAQSTGLRVKANIPIKAIVIIVVQSMNIKSAQHMVKLAILVIRKDIISSVVDPGNEARVVQDGGLIPAKDNPDVTSMR